MGQTPRSRSQGPIYWYPLKGLITRDTHVKYQSSSSYCSKVIRKFKVFKKLVKLKGQGHRVKNNATYGKVSSQGTLMSSTHCSKVIDKVKVLERRTEWQNYRLADWTKTIHPDLRSRGHKHGSSFRETTKKMFVKLRGIVKL